MDARLKSLAAAVEGGATCLPVNLVVGQWIVQGTPVTSSDFLKRTQESLSRIALDQMPGRDRRLLRAGKADHVLEAAQDQARGFMGPLAGSISGAEYALSLVDVTLTGGLSGVIHGAAVRVPLASVDVWWIAGFKHEPAKFGGGGGGMSVGF